MEVGEDVTERTESGCETTGALGKRGVEVVWRVGGERRVGTGLVLVVY